MTRASAVAAAISAIVAVPAFAPRAHACAACDCGDPTLTTMGTEKPFSGRLRLSTDLRVRETDTGTPGRDYLSNHEQRLDLAAAWAPRPWLFVSVTVPLVRHDLGFVNLGHDAAAGVGDVEVRAKGFVFQDRRFAPHHLVSLIGGARLPTATHATAADGGALNSDAQPGSGDLAPLAGLAYGGFFGAWSLAASATAVLPVADREGVRDGRSLVTTVGAQYQPTNTLAVQLSADTSWARATVENGMAIADSGGFAAFLSPRVIYSPRMDLLLHAGVAIPVLTLLNGRQQVGPVISVGATLDL